jgi:hypothetical protein
MCPLSWGANAQTAYSPGAGRNAYIYPNVMLNYSKYIFAIFIGLLILSCSNSDSALEEHQIVSEVFDKNEISNLQEILDFFTQEICTSEGGNSSNPRECFDKLQSRLNLDSP